jgi:intein/homing endonuclease
LARSESDLAGRVEPKVVEETFKRLGRVWNLRVRGKVIRTSDEHPFFVRGKGWIEATRLRPGDLLTSADGQWIAVEEVYDTGEYETLYNIRVADYHTYFVSGDGWGFSVWAHNTDCTFWRNNNGTVTAQYQNAAGQNAVRVFTNEAALRQWAGAGATVTNLATAPTTTVAARLQGHVDRAVETLQANPSLAQGLMSEGRYANLASGRTGNADFGVAVERLTARYVRDDPSLSGIVQWTGITQGPNGRFIPSPDFTATQGGVTTIFDVTTPGQVAGHVGVRDGKTVNFLLYERPQGIVFPRRN